MKNQYLRVRVFGFSLIELMTVIVIIGILTAIAIPSYQGYVRQSRTAEALANISSIGQYEEQYYSENNQYWSAGKNPATVPDAANPGGALTFNASDANWLQLGALFTNATQVRFQYYAFAGQFDASAGNVANAGLVSSSTALFSATPTTSDAKNCTSVTNGNRTAQTFGVTPVAYANWYVIAAVGNQFTTNATNSSICSLFIKVNDRAAIYKENDTE